MGDCADVLGTLPAQSVDHVITDPPYSEHVHGKQRRMLRGAGGRKAKDGGRRGEVGPADLGFLPLTSELRGIVALEAARICRRWVLAFSDAESVHGWLDDLTGAGLVHVRIGAWVKLCALPQLSGDRPGAGFEAIEIAHAADKRMRWNGGGHHGVWPYQIATDRNGAGDRIHPTQKPLALMMELVRQFTNPGDLVIDPFAGGGTTGIACVRMGRRFIGIERDENFAAGAIARLQAEDQGLAMSAHRRGQIPLFAAGGR